MVNKFEVIMGLLLMIALLPSVIGASSDKFSIIDTLQVTTIGNCSGADASSPIKFIFQIDSNDYTLARYTITCSNSSLKLERVNADTDVGIIDISDINDVLSKSDISDTKFYDLSSRTTAIDSNFSLTTTNIVDSYLSNTLLDNMCNGVTTTTDNSQIFNNLTWCLSAYNNFTNNYKIFYDDSQLLGEYRGRVTQAEANFADCQKSVDGITSERDSLNNEAKSCSGELSTASAQSSSCQSTLNSCNADKTDLKKQADQRILYAIVAAVIAGGGMFLHFTSGKRNPDKNYEEQSFPRDENY